MLDPTKMMLFTGNANPLLAQKIAKRLDVPLGKANVTTFSDGETRVEIQENVRGRDAYIIQSTCAPSNDHLMELLTIADALRRSSASSITAVIPYFGYARQDRRIRSARVPITAKIVADMITTLDINRVLTVDLHADQIQGFFSIPVDNAYATPLMLADIQRKDFKNVKIVSPDVSGVNRARAVAKRLHDGIDLAIIDKRRPRANEAQVMNVIGEVKGHHCIVIDDIIDTAGTLCKAADALKKAGASGVSAYITHPVLSGNALENLNASEIDELVVSDTIPLTPAAQKCKKIRQISLCDILATAISRVNQAKSLSSMFMD